MTNSKTIVELKNVSKKYPMDEVVVTALDKVNLQIKQNDFLAIMGPSGSGKSTLLNIIGLLDRPTSGEVFLNGENVVNFSDSEIARIRGEKIGFVFQFFNLYSTMNVLENVMLPMVIAEETPSKREKLAIDLLKKVGLEKRLNSFPAQLSGGERQRVAIARALANKPSLILADEPTGNLDTKSGESIMRLFHTLNKEGNTVVVITHEKNIAAYAEKTIYIRDGKIGVK